MSLSEAGGRVHEDVLIYGAAIYDVSARRLHLLLLFGVAQLGDLGVSS